MLQDLSGTSGLFVLKIPYKSQPYSIEELLQAIPLDTTCNLTCYMSKAIKDRTPSLYAGMYLRIRCLSWQHLSMTSLASKP